MVCWKVPRQIFLLDKRYESHEEKSLWLLPLSFYFLGCQQVRMGCSEPQQLYFDCTREKAKRTAGLLTQRPGSVELLNQAWKGPSPDLSSVRERSASCLSRGNCVVCDSSQNIRMHTAPQANAAKAC